MTVQIHPGDLSVRSGQKDAVIRDGFEPRRQNVIVAAVPGHRRSVRRGSDSANVRKAAPVGLFAEDDAL